MPYTGEKTAILAEKRIIRSDDPGAIRPQRRQAQPMRGGVPGAVQRPAIGLDRTTPGQNLVGPAGTQNRPATNPIGMYSGLGARPGMGSTMGNAAFGTANSGNVKLSEWAVRVCCPYNQNSHQGSTKLADCLRVLDKVLPNRQKHHSKNKRRVRARPKSKQVSITTVKVSHQMSAASKVLANHAINAILG